ncbi:MAG: hypothetical protein SGPRY_009688, partial [Prymnesium sp.]
VLVTGGAGYIGSHTVLELLDAGYEVTVMDNLYNASTEGLKRVEKLTGKAPKFEQVDMLDIPGMDALFAKEKFDAVIHFAGLKAVGESVAKPLFYYGNNITGTVNLLDVMTKYNCKNIVFSSSATVYGDPKSVPVDETFEPSLRVAPPQVSATNPYGRTKLFIEYILRDLYQSDNSWNIILLRYFNPVRSPKDNLHSRLLTRTAWLPAGGRAFKRHHRRGSQGHSEQLDAFHPAGNTVTEVGKTKNSHASGCYLDDDPTERVFDPALWVHVIQSTAVLVALMQVAVGRREALNVFGSDWPTKDGTGVRDYIHVVDLAKGHLAALKKVPSNPGCVTYNLGTGIGYSVLDMVKAFSKVGACRGQKGWRGYASLSLANALVCLRHVARRSLTS